MTKLPVWKFQYRRRKPRGDLKMPLHPLTESLPKWIMAPGNSPEPVLLCQCMLARNLAGFNFPDRCHDEERRITESRILNALEKIPSLAKGRYYSTSDLDRIMMRFLAERRIVPAEFLGPHGTRGIYVAKEQSMGIIVNMSDHLLFRFLSSGETLEQLWTLADALDNQFGALLDYAYQEHRGFLTSSLRLTGTGLKFIALLHLPAIAMLEETTRVAGLLLPKRLSFRGLALGEPPSAPPSPTPPPISGCLAAEIEPASFQSLYLDILGTLQTEPEQTVGNLFLLASQDTLGVSEGECLFQMEQALSIIVREEERARERLLSAQRGILMDRIGRALGIARSARLLGMRETLALASMIRLAAAMGLVTGCNRNALNQALLECQQAHLQILRGIAPEPKALATERAHIFRALFAGTEMN